MSRLFQFKFVALQWWLLLGIASIQAAQTPEEVGEKYITTIREDGLVACLHFWHPEGVQQLADLLTELADVAVSKGVQPPFAEKNETAESLKKLSAKQLVEKFVKWLEREVPQITGVLKTSQVRVIGHVTDGEITYLVAKVAFEVEGEKTEQLDFYPLKKLGDEYRLMPKAEFGRVVRGWIKQIKNDR